MTFNTRTGKGGQILPSPHVFCEYLPKYLFDRRDFFNTCPKINGTPFGAKIEDSSILGGLFLGPQSQHFRFSPSWSHDGGVLAPPPAPAGPALRRPVARGGAAGRWGCRPGAGGGGVPAERLGGRRRPVKVTDSRERRPGEPSSGGHRPGRRRRTNEDEYKGSGSIYLHVRHLTLKIKMRVRKYYYSNYVLE